MLRGKPRQSSEDCSDNYLTWFHRSPYPNATPTSRLAADATSIHVLQTLYLMRNSSHNSSHFLRYLLASNWTFMKFVVSESCAFITLLQTSVSFLCSFIRLVNFSRRFRYIAL